MRGFSTFTSNDGPPEVFDTTVSLGRDTNQTRPVRPTTTTSAMMISDIFIDLFMHAWSPQIVAVVNGRDALVENETAKPPRSAEHAKKIKRALNLVR